MNTEHIAAPLLAIVDREVPSPLRNLLAVTWLLCGSEVPDATNVQHLAGELTTDQLARARRSFRELGFGDRLEREILEAEATLTQARSLLQAARWLEGDGA